MGRNLSEHLTGVRKTTVIAVATNALGMKTDRIGTADQKRIVAILKLLGWEPKRDNHDRWWERG